MGSRVAPLSALLSSFIKLVVDPEGWMEVDELRHADGVWFLCPKCYVGAGRTFIGVHRVVCWAPHVPQTYTPKPGRWAMHGTGLADLSLVAGSSSVLINGGCRAHFFVRNGWIEDMAP